MSAGPGDPYTLNAYRLVGRTVDQGPPASRDDLGPNLSFGGLGPAPLEEVAQAVARLRDPSQEGREAATWFRLACAADQQAWGALCQGQEQAAWQIWTQAAEAGESSARDNLAVMAHIMALAQPDSPEAWASAVHGWYLSAQGGNVHRQAVLSAILGELEGQADRAVARGDAPASSAWLKALSYGLDPEALNQLQVRLFKAEADALRLRCAEIRSGLLKVGPGEEQQLRDLERMLGQVVLPRARFLANASWGEFAVGALREVALLYRSQARVWASVMKNPKEQCLALEGAVQWASPELKKELGQELAGARLDRDAPPDLSSQAGPASPSQAPQGNRLPEEVVLPRSSTILGTGLALVRLETGSPYQARYVLSVLGISLLPLAQFKVWEEIPGAPSRVDRMPLSTGAMTQRVVLGFVLVLLAMTVLGGVFGSFSGSSGEQRRAVEHQINTLLPRIADMAQKCAQVDEEVKAATSEVEKLGNGPRLGEARERLERLKTRQTQLHTDHQKLVKELEGLEQKRQSL